MNRLVKRIFVPGLVLPALLVGGCDSPEPFSPESSEHPLFAAAQPTPLTTYFSANPIAMGEWTSTGGMLHIRSLVGRGSVSGYMAGTVTAELDADLLAETGEGPSRASATIEVTDLDGHAVSGTWEGQLRGRIRGFPGPAFTHWGHFVGHGTGELAGMKIWGTYTNEANPGLSDYVLTGRILDPTGE